MLISRDLLDEIMQMNIENVPFNKRKRTNGLVLQGETGINRICCRRSDCGERKYLEEREWENESKKRKEGREEDIYMRG